jgi:hypothetical protein
MDIEYKTAVCLNGYTIKDENGTTILFNDKKEASLFMDGYEHARKNTY